MDTNKDWIQIKAASECSPEWCHQWLWSRVMRSPFHTVETLLCMSYQVPSILYTNVECYFLSNNKYAEVYFEHNAWKYNIIIFRDVCNIASWSPIFYIAIPWWYNFVTRRRLIGCLLKAICINKTMCHILLNFNSSCIVCFKPLVT